MTKNPILNALAALAYISIVASIMFYGNKHSESPDTVIIPITMISLLTLSAVMMSYIFGLAPLRLYLDGKKKEGVKLFVQTLAIFGGVTALLLILLISKG